MCVQHPNLPNKVKTVLIGEEYCSLLSKELNSLGIEVIPIPKNPFVDTRISSHADLSVLHLCDDLMLLSKHLEGSCLVGLLEELGFKCTFSKAEIGEAYHFDCPLNAYISENFAVYNPDTVASEAKEFIENSGKMSIFCKQGYSKCMICPVDSNSIITSDPSIEYACKQQGIDVLKIRAGFVDLMGYNYGFLGGSCFKISSDCIAFTGKLDLHPDRELIFNFIKNKGMECIFLSDLNVFDVGSIIPIIEKPR